MFSRSLTVTTAAAAALGLAGLCGGCSSGTAQASKGDPNALFLTDTAHSSNSEIALSQVALERASNPRVREYAQMMVRDHQRGNQDLMTVAQQKGMDVPKRPDELHAKMAASMRQMSGEQFDREYMSAMVADHARLVSKFQDKAANAQDPQVRAFAASQLPVVQMHLDHAREINRSLGGASTVTARPSTGGAAMPAGHNMSR
jgi:putative membrane protein